MTNLPPRESSSDDAPNVGPHDAVRARNIDMALEERLGGRMPPDLSERILAALGSRKRKSTDAAVDVTHDEAVGLRLVASAHGEQPGPCEMRQRRLAIAAAAACVVVGMGLIWFGDYRQSSRTSDENHALEAGTHDDSRKLALPPGAMAGEHCDAVLYGDTLRLRDGWLLLDERVGGVRVGERTVAAAAGGRVLVCAGYVPSAQSTQNMSTWLENNSISLSKEERLMLNDTKQWIVKGGLAVCALAGGALIDGKAVSAQEAGGIGAAPAGGPILEEGASKVAPEGETKVPAPQDGPAGEDKKKKEDTPAPTYIFRLDMPLRPAAVPFVEIDKNGDGKLGEGEVDPEIIKRGDKDGDGMLTEDEHKAVLSDVTFVASTRKGEKSESPQGAYFHEAVNKLELVAEAAKPFSELDKNGDGKLGEGEVDPETLKRGDKDGDGVLSGEEYAGSGQTVHMVEMVQFKEDKQEFKAIDVNGDGELTGEELNPDIVRNADTDRDGVLNEAEWKAFDTSGVMAKRIVTGTAIGVNTLVGVKKHVDEAADQSAKKKE